MKRKSTGEYPDDWKEIAKAVKDAAEWKCVRCGKLHDPANGYTLTVHHLDINPANCAWWNLPPLCQRCHLVIQSKVVMERSWMFDHTPWFQPCAAAYYGVEAGLLPSTINYFDSLVLVRVAFVVEHLHYLLALGKPVEQLIIKQVAGKHLAILDVMATFRIIRAGQESQVLQSTKAGCVYVVKPAHSNVYKIGETTDLERRLKTLRRKFAFDLEVVYSAPVSDSYQVEQRIHMLVGKFHLGGDWFALDPETLGKVIGYLRGAK